MKITTAQLREIIREEIRKVSLKEAAAPMNNLDLDKYAAEFQDFFYKKYKNKNINGWELSTDGMSGTFYWDKKGSKVSVLATPYWDGQQSLPVDVQNIETGEPELQTKYPLDATGDKKKDEEAFLKMLKQALSKVG